VIAGGVDDGAVAGATAALGGGAIGAVADDGAAAGGISICDACGLAAAMSGRAV